MSTLTLAKAKEILKKHTTEDHLFTHAAAVSAAMGAMASIFGGDKDHWEAIGSTPSACIFSCSNLSTSSNLT